MATRPTRISCLKTVHITAAILVLALALFTPAPAHPPLSSINRTSAEAASRLLWLSAEIARHDDLYFKHATPEITDSAYDALKREQQAIALTALTATASPISAPPPPVALPTTAPTPRLGDDRNGDFPSAPHRQPMLSLAKAYTETELRAFITNVEQELRRTDLSWLIEPKFDGLAISVTYQNGRLLRVLTRGDGHQGEDVTANVSTIPELVRALPSGYPQWVELRGEVFVDHPEFTRLNAEREESGAPPFANPRNLAAGTLKLHDEREVAKRHLRIVFYGLGAWDGPPTAPVSQQDLHARIRAWGLPGIETFTVAHTPAEVWAAVAQLGRQRPSLAFPTDGAVIKIDDRSLQNELGTSATAPHWAVAFKFTPERVSTRLLAISLQVGRTGIITPIAELAPVVIGGTTLSRSTLYNADSIARLDLRLGDWVFVEKAGDIIPVVVAPDITRRAATALAYILPSTCPACGSHWVRNDGETTIRCIAHDCPGQLRRRIEHFASPQVANLKGLGPATIATLVSANRLHTIADLYKLTHEDLVNVVGISGEGALSLLAKIEHSKHLPLARLIYGMSIPGIGRTAAAQSAQDYTDLARWFSAQSKHSARYETDTPAALQDFLSQPENTLLIKELIALGVDSKNGPKPRATAALELKTVTLTGTLPTLSRAEATKRIEAAGGRVTQTVSKRTDFLVAGEGAGAKTEQARALGIEIINETQLLQRLTP